MAIELICGFDCASTLDKWTISGAATIGTSIVRTGPRSGHIANAGASAYFQHFFNAASVTSVGRFYFYWESLPTTAATDWNILLGIVSAGTQPKITVTSTGVVKFGYTSLVTHGTTVTTGQWYLMDYRILNNDGTGTKKMDFRINKVTATQATLTEAGSNVTAVRIGAPGVTATTTVNIDDVILADDTALYPFGEGQVTAVIVNGDGTHSYTAGDFGDNAGVVLSSSTILNQRVSKSPMTAAGAAISATFLEQIVTRATGYLEFTFPLSQIVGTINGVGVTAAVQAETAAAGTSFLRVNDNGTVETGTTWGSSSVSVVTIRHSYKQFGLRPSSSTVWTPASMSTLRIRWGFSDDAAPDVRLEALMLEIDRNPNVWAPAQAQADIKVTSRGFAQAQADIKATSFGFAQARAYIFKGGYGQAQAWIKQTYPNANNAVQQTKFYLHDVTTTNTGTLPSAQVGTVTVLSTATGANINRVLNGTIGVLQASSPASLADSSTAAFARRFVSSPLGAQMFYGASNWSALVSAAMSQSDAAATGTLYTYITIWRPSTGLEIKGTSGNPFFLRLAFITTAGATEKAGSGSIATNLLFGGESLTTQVGDILVLETYLYSNTGGVSANTQFFYDGTTEASAVSNAAFIEFDNGGIYVLNGTVNGPTFAQAQASIKVTSNGFAQAQADIKAVGRGFAQAQADIKAVGFGFGQAQADIKAVGFGFGQAQANIKQTYNAFAQAQADIKATNNGFGQAQADIKAVSFGFAQAQADIKAIGYGFGQAQANIKATSNGFGQAQADIKAVSFGFAQAQADIKATSFGFGQSQADISVTSNAFAQAQAYVTHLYIRNFETADTGAAQGTGDVGITINVPAGTVDDDVMYMIIHAASSTGVFVTPAGWTVIEAQFASTNQANSKTMVWRRIASSEPASYTILWGGAGNTGRAVGAIVTIAGADIFIPEQDIQIDMGNGPTNTEVLPSVTATTYTLMLGFASAYTPTTGANEWTPPSDMLEIFDISTTNGGTSNASMELSRVYIPVGPSGTRTATGTLSDLHPTGVMIALNPLLSHAGYGQAQADIVQTYFGFAQAQATIKATNNGYGQAQAAIKAVGYGFGQAQADIKAVSYGFGQAQGYVYRTERGYAQATALIDGAHILFDSFNRDAQVEWGTADSGTDWSTSPDAFTDGEHGALATDSAEPTGVNQYQVTFDDLEAEIKFRLPNSPTDKMIFAWNGQDGEGGSNKDSILILTSQAVEGGTADLVFGEGGTQLWTDTDIILWDTESFFILQIQSYHTDATNKTLAYRIFKDGDLAPAWTIHNDVTVANRWGWITLASTNTSSGFPDQYDYINIQEYAPKAYAQAQAYIVIAAAYGFGQAQADILVTEQGYGQAQALIVTTNNAFGQAQATILLLRNAFGQAQADILATSNGYAQAQAHILATGQGYGQAQARIGTVNNGYGQAQGTILATSNAFGQAQADIKSTSNAYGQAQADIKVTSQGYAQAQANISAAGYAFGQAQATIKAVGQGYGQSQADIRATSNAYAQAQAYIKITGYGFGQANAKIILRQQGYAQAQATILATVSGLGQAQAGIRTTYNGLGQAQAQITTLTSGVGQAQAYIRHITPVYGQAQADIKAVTNMFGQAQGSILATATSHGNAQADIKTTVIVIGQAEATILATYRGYAQANAAILTTYTASANAMALIVVTDISAFGQAQAFILKAAGYGQAQAFIFQRHVLKNLTVSDSRLVTSMISDEFDTEITLTDTSVKVFVSDIKAVTLTLSDEADDNLMLSDIQH